MQRRDFLRGALGAAGLASVASPMLRGMAGASVPAAVGGDDRPWWQTGDFAPVTTEITAERLPVRGSLPRSLSGLYVRNGSNSRTSHWFIGDGMVHGVHLEDGEARWYRSRFVQTKLHTTGATDLGQNGPPRLDEGFANVSVVHHAKRLLASGEVGLPWELSPDDLSTVGVYDFGGRLTTSMTAHPKIDPATGEMHFFGYGFTPGSYLTYHVANASGVLVSSQPVEVAQPTMIHDFAITDRDVVFWELPVVFDLGALATGIPFRWHPEYGARIGIMPLGGPATAIRWVEIEPCYVFHGVNAFRDGDDVVVDVCRHQKMFAPGVTDSGKLTLRRWRVATTGTSLRFSEDIVETDDPGELPTRDPRLVGRAHRYGYLLQSRNRRDRGLVFKGVVKQDFERGTRERWDPGPGRQANEFLFVPSGPGEDEGHLLSYVFDANRERSDLVVLDATDVRAGPVATVELPARVPYGFHATWVPSS
jgi:carotenoid cleavage dioxygenase-like enzyme